MDIHDFKTRLERTEKRIECSAFSDKNKKIISDYKRQLFIKELSIARIAAEMILRIDDVIAAGKEKPNLLLCLRNINLLFFWSPEDYKNSDDNNR